MIDETAHQLIEARRAHRAMSAASCGTPDVEAAYAAQDAVANACSWFREAPAGHWKSGGPSRDAVLTHAAAG